MSSQNRKKKIRPGGDGLLRKVKDLGAKELDDRGKMDLKDLLMFGRE